MTVTVNTDTVEMDAAVAHYLEHSKTKPNGVREVPKKAFMDAMEKRGVSEDTYKLVQEAVDFQTTVAARVALADNERKVGETSKEDLENDDFRRKISSTVRIPTLGGATEVECFLETVNPIPNRGEGEAEFKTTHGRFRTKINAKGRIDKGLIDEARQRIRASLNLGD